MQLKQVWQQYPAIHGNFFTSHFPHCRCSAQLYVLGPVCGGGTSVQAGGGGAGGGTGTGELKAALKRAEAGFLSIVKPYAAALPFGAVVHAQ